MSTPYLLHVKPAPGRLVRWPNTRRLAPDGDRVPRSPYWLRRLECGDVVEVPAAPPILEVRDVAPPELTESAHDIVPEPAPAAPPKPRARKESP
ncbi:DUF2635 domain-containing protein [Lysobacter sp. LF1]|uniref:DUF2635 domain-containing protein n=1 Tax=Lysobacter stagni TaxID=3045172 RepID=A0ABT6XKY8_9GAMM|nr:DUF2635 domain-containing protein [Lysobacter sp. LF1]MDI9240739.1 DUF2635 domain-containing protein [Lysobacter sp. LF1]